MEKKASPCNKKTRERQAIAGSPQGISTRLLLTRERWVDWASFGRHRVCFEFADQIGPAMSPCWAAENVGRGTPPPSDARPVLSRPSSYSLLFLKRSLVLSFSSSRQRKEIKSAANLGMKIMHWALIKGIVLKNSKK